MTEDIYAAARELKGAGSGTKLGYYISNFSTYQQVSVTFFDFYNNCSLDYYMVAVGSNVQSLSGLLNFVTNGLFRAYSSDTSLEDLYTAVTDYSDSDTSDNLLALGKAVGVLAIQVLQVAIPTTSSDGVSYYQTASAYSN